jgi:uncharacterized membrane protein SpoIIM required for sporulation
VPISPQTARQIVNPINQTLNQNRASGTVPQYIFLNNFKICLAMFIPIIGPIWGFIVLFSSGYTIGAISQVQGFPPILEILALILTPVFWLEFTAYSIGMTESIWLLRRLLQKRFLEFKNTAILIGVCAALLAVGAVVETWLISIGA